MVSNMPRMSVQRFDVGIQYLADLLMAINELLVALRSRTCLVVNR